MQGGKANAMTARRKRAGRFLMGLFLLVLLAEGGLRLAARMPAPDLSRAIPLSDAVYASDGTLLHLSLTVQDRVRLPPGDGRDTAAVPEQFRSLLLIYEDKRFMRHDGIDRLAIARAMVDGVRDREIRSGASTITMQLARLVSGTPRSFAGKFRQMLIALRIERRYSKDEILAAYLTLAPYGSNIEGAETAAHLYFRRPLDLLSLPEIALLVALPQSPEARRPDRFPGRAIAARNAVLRRGVEAGILTPAAAIAASKTPLGTVKTVDIPNARHLLARLPRTGEGAGRRRAVLTIDPALQGHTRDLLDHAARAVGSGAIGAAAVMRISDGAVLAYVGGASRFDAPGAFLDMLRAPRSPGSSLKPLAYLLAFERRRAHPETVVRDAPVSIDGYAPENFDRRYLGDITIRDALQRSINTVATRMAQLVGPAVLVRKIEAAGGRLDWRGRSSGVEAGLAVIVGGCAIAPFDLMQLYASLAARGQLRPAHLIPDELSPPGTAVFSDDAAWAITDILADAPLPEGFRPARATDGGRRIAFKTGTSYGRRDSIAVGFDKAHVAIVWIGRPDARPVYGALGLKSAAPVLLRLFDLLPRPETDVASPAPVGSPLAANGVVPERLRRLAEASTLRPLSILHPAPGSTIEPTRADGRIALRADGGMRPYIWYADGERLGASAMQEGYRPLDPGAVQMMVVDARGMIARSTVWITTVRPP